MRRSPILWVAVVLTLAFGALSGCSSGPRGEVSFVQPIDGAQVVSPFWVEMAKTGSLIVEPAFAFGVVGGGVGHYAVIVDETADLDTEKTVKPTETIFDYDKGQTSARIEVAPGQHTLTLYFIRNNGLPYTPFVKKTITVNVVESRSVSFIEPEDRSSQVGSQVTIKIASEGLNVEPASAGVTEGSGHHHILVDKLVERSPNFNNPLDSIPINPVPFEDGYIHLEEGQTEITLDLPRGQHILRLLFAKGDNLPYDPPITDSITFTVRDP